MERVRISELVERHEKRRRKRLSHAEIGAAVFAGDVTRPKEDGNRQELSEARKTWLITRWNKGHALTAIKPRHLFRLAALFGVTKLADILEQ